MILKLLQGVLNLFLAPIMALFSFVIDMDSVAAIVTQTLDYMRMGLAIVDFFCPLNLISPCITVVITVYAALQIYHLVMFVLKKIPFVGVE